MSRFRDPHHALSHLVSRSAFTTLGLLMLLLVAGGVFAYQLSPLRDPSFQPDSANAGSLLPWARGIYESTWILGSSVLAGFLASNLVLVFCRWARWRPSATPKFWLFIVWTGVGLVLFGLLDMVFIGYLMTQWLVD